MMNLGSDGLCHNAFILLYAEELQSDLCRCRRHLQCTNI